MKEIITKVFEFEELSETAKKKAIEWYQEISAGDSDWADYVIEDAKRMGGLMGLDIQKVYWSGFSSSGDGAMFVGTWRAKDVTADKLKQEAPEDKELHRIANEFESFAKQFPEASFTVKHAGRYCHKHSADFDIDLGAEYNEVEENNLKEIARDFMDWIYDSLQKEYDYQNSDEVIIDNIKANEYTFTETGKRFG